MNRKNQWGLKTIGVQHFKSYNMPRITTTFVSKQKKSLSFNTLHFKNYNISKIITTFVRMQKKSLTFNMSNCYSSREFLKYSHVVIFTKGSSLVMIMITLCASFKLMFQWKILSHCSQTVSNVLVIFFIKVSNIVMFISLECEY
jgi:hypothetical protein